MKSNEENEIQPNLSDESKDPTDAESILIKLRFVGSAEFTENFLNPEALQKNIPNFPNERTVEYLKELFTPEFIQQLVDIKACPSLSGKIILLPRIFPEEYEMDRFIFHNRTFPSFVDG